jgi:hypothetical protein
MLPETVFLWAAHKSTYEPDSGFQWSGLQPQTLERPAPTSTYVAALDELVAALDGHGELRSDGEVGRRSMAMVAALYQSQLAGNRPVRFPLTDRGNPIVALRDAGWLVDRQT